MSDAWTVEDAVALLDPPMTADQLRALIKVAGIRPVGQRHTGRRGRPAEVFDSAELLRAHAAVARFLVAGDGERMD